MTDSIEEGSPAAAVAGEPAFVYPKDERDGWEPGEPSLRAMTPSSIGGGLVPLAVYYGVRHAVSSDATALAIAGIPAAAWVAFQWVRRRSLDPIGALVLFGFVAGLTVSLAMGGDAFVLKVRNSVFTLLFGVASLLSLWIGRRPLMFYLGRQLSAGDDAERLRLYNELWELPPARTVFRIITFAWGIGLLLEAAVGVTLALILPTGVFLAVAPFATGIIVVGLFAFTIGFSRWSRRRTEEAMSADFPEGGGSAFWWARFWLTAHRSRTAPAIDLSPSEG